MNDVYVAFLWHQHQPYYKDVLTGRFVLPWARLHGIKDYIGMAMTTAQFPQVKLTINMVPALLTQIEDYARGGGEDELLRLARLHPRDLDPDQQQFILSNSFSANFHTMIAPHRRYRQLYRKCQAEGFALNRHTPLLSEQELMDLQVWSMLAWFHPLLAGSDTLLSGLIEKDRDFTQREKEQLLDKQTETLQQIVPLHRKLQDAGQIEISTSPYYHPILPLLCDLSSAEESHPGVSLPAGVSAMAGDARIQVEQAVTNYRQSFGHPPVGFWPPEGAVSDRIIPLLCQAGFKWLASDEEILARSLGVSLSRGSAQRSELLYQPYIINRNGQGMQMVFRDRHLSDLIGFQYHRLPAAKAADDLLARLRCAGRIKSRRPPLVCIILDGENPWEYYENCGVDFLKELYSRLSRTPGIITTTVSGYLEQFPAEETLSHLFAGSWVNHNFDIWIGDEQDNRAWQYLYHTRDFLVQKERSDRGLDPQNRRQAWEQIYIAQGSDWFWWFGSEHSSGQDDVFDYLFRKHLENAYALLGETPAGFLKEPICRRREKIIYRTPTALLEVKVEGKPTNYFEWIGAGRYQCKRSRSTMAMVTRPLVEEIFFGFDLAHFFLRLDPSSNSARQALKKAQLILHLEKPGKLVVEVSGVDGEAKVLSTAGGKVQAVGGARVALDKVVELSLPFQALGIVDKDEASFYLEVEAASSSQRIPREGAIAFTAPSPDFETELWQV